MSKLASPETVTQRIVICTPCEFKKTNFFVSVCSECKCVIPAKVRLESSTCPKGKW